MDWVEVFNTWRIKYGKMTIYEQRAFYNMLYNFSPIQKYYNLNRVEEFLNLVSNEIREIKIFEMGGWDGELAKDVIEDFPFIKYWHNYELCEMAVKNNVCKNEKYKPILIDKFLWESEFDTEYNTGIFSHVLEHCRLNEIECLLKKLDLIFIYIDMPPITSWRDNIGTHILEEPPDGVLFKLGFFKFFHDGGVSFWKK